MRGAEQGSLAERDVAGGTIYIEVSGGAFKLCRQMACKAEVGGRSHIRKDHTDRMEAIKEDQLVGQLGTYAATVQVCGSAKRYIESRQKANANPYAGDGGEDIPGANLDVKTSLARVDRAPEEFNLVVRPKERHPDWVYVLALVTELNAESAVVALVGWITEDKLPLHPNSSGVFEGAYVVRGANLLPMVPITWSKVSYLKG